MKHLILIISAVFLTMTALAQDTREPFNYAAQYRQQHALTPESQSEGPSCTDLFKECVLAVSVANRLIKTLGSHKSEWRTLIIERYESDMEAGCARYKEQCREDDSDSGS